MEVETPYIPGKGNAACKSRLGRLSLGPFSPETHPPLQLHTHPADHPSQGGWRTDERRGGALHTDKSLLLLSVVITALQGLFFSGHQSGGVGASEHWGQQD